MAINVVLDGSNSDRANVEKAVRLAVQQRESVDVLITSDYLSMLVAKYTDFPCWDVEARSGLSRPTINVSVSAELPGQASVNLN